MGGLEEAERLAFGFPQHTCRVGFGLGGGECLGDAIRPSGVAIFVREDAALRNPFTHFP